jgi:hypothetical protein
MLIAKVITWVNFNKYMDCILNAPIGNLLCYNIKTGKHIAIDNTSGEFFVEEFETLDEAFDYFD